MSTYVFKHDMYGRTVFLCRYKSYFVWIVSRTRVAPTKGEIKRVFRGQQLENMESLNAFYGVKGLRALRTRVSGNQILLKSVMNTKWVKTPKTREGWKDLFLIAYSMILDSANRG